jgi:hypothetical protein
VPQANTALARRIAVHVKMILVFDISVSYL